MTYILNDVQNLSSKGVVLAGGTTGIGRAIACLLVTQGAKLLVYGRHEAELQDALRDIESAASQGGQVFGLIADQSKWEDVQRVFAEADEKLPRVDILINCASLAAHSILDMEYEEWVSVVHTNLIGYMSTCREAIDRMKAQGAGHIVNIGSLSAKVRESGSDVYVATKAGVEGFSESLRKQVNEMGIQVTLIEPGLVGTDMTVEQVPAEEQERKIAEGAMLKAEDIARWVYYALIQPRRSNPVLIQVRPHGQRI